MTATRVPIPSGADSAPKCAKGNDCTGYRTYHLPSGLQVDGHCSCPLGRRKAEEDYAHRTNSPVPGSGVTT